MQLYGFTECRYLHETKCKIFSLFVCYVFHSKKITVIKYGHRHTSIMRGPGFETYRRRVVSLSKTLYSPKVLVNYPGSDGSVPRKMSRKVRISQRKRSELANKKKVRIDQWSGSELTSGQGPNWLGPKKWGPNWLGPYHPRSELTTYHMCVLWPLIA